MSDNFSIANKFTADWEGGLSDDKYDRGGITNYGVSIVFLKECVQKNIDTVKSFGITNLPVTRETIKGLTKAQAAALFRWRFWSSLHLDDMPLKLAVLLYDAAVNHGPNRSVRFAQQAYNMGTTYGTKLVVDGILGPLTRDALKKTDTPVLHKNMLFCREDFYYAIVNNDRTQEKFLKGWLNRVSDLRRYLETL